MNRWLVGAAAAGAGVLSLVAAESFHGKARAATPSATTRSASVSSVRSHAAKTGTRARHRTTAITSAPAPAATTPAVQQAPAPVVSGGS
jgi:hypothetical protein